MNTGLDRPERNVYHAISNQNRGGLRRWKIKLIIAYGLRIGSHCCHQQQIMVRKRIF